MDRPLYPFTAVVGRERAKQAPLCLAMEPRIGGVLLCGGKGTTRPTLVQALGGLDGVRLLELPMSAMEDILLGGVELEAAVRTDRRTFQPGLLVRADGAMLYADEVSLFPFALTAALLDTLETGVCRVERDGTSHICPTRFVLVGVMNPKEETLHPQLLNRFGLCVTVTEERELEARREVVRHRSALEEKTATFRAQWTQREERLAGQLATARALLPQVDVGEAEEQATCLLARQANAAEHRARLAILHTARTLAALAERTYINLEDLHVAAELALPHRRRKGSGDPSPRRERGEEPPQGSEADGRAGGGDGPADESHPTDGPPQERTQAPVPPTEQGPSRKRLKQGENLYEMRTLLTTRVDRPVRRDSGRRSKTRSATRRGRAVGNHIPRGKAGGLAVGATLRAATPYQWSRNGGRSGPVILPPNLRAKIQESRVGTDIVFAADANGSMGAIRQMKEVKETVLSVSIDSCQKRGQVGLVTSRSGEAAAVLELTRSVELAQWELQVLPTGGRTPLATGLEEARRMLERQRRRVRDSLPLLMLITDDRANFSRGGDPVEETLRAARRMAETHIPAVVIGTERQFISLGLTAQVAQVMDTPCYRVEELQARPLAQLARGHSPAAG